MTDQSVGSTRDRSLLIPAAVYAGAVVLIGFPATLLLFEAFGTVLAWLGMESVVASAWGLAIVGASFLLGLQLAVEAAAVQLGGVEALGRGDSPRIAMARYLLATAVAFVAVATVAWIGFSAATGGYGWAAVALGGAVALAGAVALYRGVTALRRGIGSTTV